jgi:DNA polymerase-3 subunit gamma/tau|tara:strand:- start:1158 stop:2834 length:1677 start_codon:yes stop_codon:yes gene_type:complete
MTTNSKVLALKYRPVVFEDLIGQQIVSETILNSIKENKVPNAYLFTGIRGVGKTTTARLVAKALNCLNGIENICKKNFCKNCESISNSNHIDVLEMDAASKTGVDDVRDLIEFSRYGPTSAKYKIFIIDEVHMLSKQAFNALLKTLEEPPQYNNGGGLKFIFATTEVKKIPITVVSRCQRFDLSRVKSAELFNYIKKIKEKEKGNITDEALKLIVKMSEGSVRDALSLLDRAILSIEKNNELDLKGAQKIFGYFDKSQLIELFENIFEGNEEKVLSSYRLIYDQGIEPKIFLNDFLEVLYYFKNINSLKIEGTNFSLNDEQFKCIKSLVEKLDNETLILFWQFTINVMQELDVVSNQNLSIEMFLIRLIHLKAISNTSTVEINDKENNFVNKNFNEIPIKKNDSVDTNNAIEQIKNIVQEKNIEKNIKNKNEQNDKFQIKSFDNLIKICTLKKELKLKYELETNVNLVSFENRRIEISFNEDLDKEFIKILSIKLFEWTNERWIISLSKEAGKMSRKSVIKDNKKKLLDDAKKSMTYKKILASFSDAQLIDVESEDKN